MIYSIVGKVAVSKKYFCASTKSDLFNTLDRSGLRVELRVRHLRPKPRKPRYGKTIIAFYCTAKMSLYCIPSNFNRQRSQATAHSQSCSQWCLDMRGLCCGVKSEQVRLAGSVLPPIVSSVGIHGTVLSGWERPCGAPRGAGASGLLLAVGRSSIPFVVFPVTTSHLPRSGLSGPTGDVLYKYQICCGGVIQCWGGPQTVFPFQPLLSYCSDHANLFGFKLALRATRPRRYTSSIWLAIPHRATLGRHVGAFVALR